MQLKKFKDLIKWADRKNYTIVHNVYGIDDRLDCWKMTKETETFSVLLFFFNKRKTYEIDFISKNADRFDEWSQNYGFEKMPFHNTRQLQQFIRAISRVDRSFVANGYNFIDTERNRKDKKFIDTFDRDA